MTGRDNVVPDDDGNDEDAWLGQVLAERYRVDARIGRGGMGVVYRGTHLELGKRVAIKRMDFPLANETLAFERFRREAIAAGRVDSPYVVQVFDWGKAPDLSPFIVMELLEGASLRHRFEQEGRLAAADATKIAVQVLRGLLRIHQAGILHRDLKPENIFLCEYEKAEPFVKLLDFGISKDIDPRAETHDSTETGVVLGTAAYMSPEQAMGDQELDVRSDLYSLGAVLYEALTGAAPHGGRTYAATLVDICTRDADDVRLHCPLVPEALAMVVKRALMRDRAERFTSSDQFLDALLNAMPALRLNHDSGRAALPSERDATMGFAPTVLASVVTPRASFATAKNRQPTAAWALGLLVAVAALAVIAYRQTRPRTPIDALPPPVVTASAMPSPSSSVVSSATPNQQSTSTTPQTLVSPLARTSATKNPGATVPIVTRKLGPTSTAVGSPQPSVGVAGGLKLRRTMP